MAELELIPRPCPFCGDLPDCNAYHDAAGKLTMYSVNCNNEYCMVQPGVQMYGVYSQRLAIAHWNGDFVQCCISCRHMQYIDTDMCLCNEHGNTSKHSIDEIGYCADWERRD